jgi:hypothetical protein
MNKPTTTQSKTQGDERYQYDIRVFHGDIPSCRFTLGIGNSWEPLSAGLQSIAADN